jgi:hypothetical protein
VTPIIPQPGSVGDRPPRRSWGDWIERVLAVLAIVTFLVLLWLALDWSDPGTNGQIDIGRVERTDGGS